ncbi:Uncharacterized protein Fot_36103 [Forsythia ovata]|uniref:Uncharacterized protein n=1 Tax=Forsythia ovata TaxID=205694 RepID=A0ABD1SNG7_9LAMI
MAYGTREVCTLRRSEDGSPLRYVCGSRVFGSESGQGVFRGSVCNNCRKRWGSFSGIQGERYGIRDWCGDLCLAFIKLFINWIAKHRIEKNSKSPMYDMDRPDKAGLRLHGPFWVWARMP